MLAMQGSRVLLAAMPKDVSRTSDRPEVVPNRELCF
jgi:hypothetical protein